MIDRKKHIEDLMRGSETFRRKALGLARIKNSAITGSQWLVLGYISRNEGCTTNAAAAALNMTGSAVTQLVNGLVEKKYITRAQDPADRRAHALTLSESSKKRFAELKKKRITLMLKLFEALTDKEFKRYVALNRKILTSLSPTSPTSHEN